MRETGVLARNKEEYSGVLSNWYVRTDCYGKVRMILFYGYSLVADIPETWSREDALHDFHIGYRKL